MNAWMKAALVSAPLALAAALMPLVGRLQQPHLKQT